MTKKIQDMSWSELNSAVINMTDESKLVSLLDDEKKGKKRVNYMMRIHSRLNKVRADRERAEINKIAGVE